MINNEVLSRIKSWNKGKPQAPYAVRLHLSQYCNLDCIFCNTKWLRMAKLKDHTFKKEMETKDWIKVIKEGSRFGVKEWQICGGGEPLFNKNKAREVILEIKKYKGYGSLVTNGTLFSEELIEDMVIIGWDELCFSIDSPNFEAYSEIRRNGDLNKVKKNINLFNYYKKKHSTNKPILSINFVVCTKNYLQIPKMIEICSKKKIHGIQLLELVVWSEKEKKYQLNSKQKSELQKILTKSAKIAKQLDIVFNTNDLIFKKKEIELNNLKERKKVEVIRNKACLKNASCFTPWYLISVKSSGEILPCFGLVNSGIYVQDSNLRDIWLGRHFNGIRKRLIHQELTNDCLACRDLEDIQRIQNALK
jgi:MoaA/NifB/PqqE/SkfB family radical SAM enzyme